MEKIPIKLGPLALLSTIISICLTTLAILTFTTASADSRMADRYAASVSSRYEVEMQGQKFLQSVDRAVSSGRSVKSIKGVKASKNTFTRAFTDGGYRLTVGVRTSGRRYEVVKWNIEKIWSTQDKIKGLWKGN